MEHGLTRPLMDHPDRIEVSIALVLVRSQSLTDTGQDVAEDADQPLRVRPLLLTLVLKLVLGLLGDGRHAFTEHRGYVVAGSDPGEVKEAGDEGKPALPTHLPHVVGVGHPRLAGEIGNLGRWDPLQPR